MRTRELARIRDKHTCQNKECGKEWKLGERSFDIHHLNGDCGKKSRSYDRLDSLGNLITLCHKCHMNLEEVKEKIRNKSSQRPLKDRFIHRSSGH